MADAASTHPAGSGPARAPASYLEAATAIPPRTVTPPVPSEARPAVSSAPQPSGGSRKRAAQGSPPSSPNRDSPPAANAAAAAAANPTATGSRQRQRPSRRTSGGVRNFTDREILQGHGHHVEAQPRNFFPPGPAGDRRPPIQVRGCSDIYTRVFAAIRAFRRLSKEAYDAAFVEESKLTETQKRRYRSNAKKAIKDGMRQLGINESGPTSTGSARERSPSSAPDISSANEEPSGAARAPSERALVAAAAARAAAMTPAQRCEAAGIPIPVPHAGLGASQEARDIAIAEDEAQVSSKRKHVKRAKGARPKKVWEQSDSRAIGTKIDFLEAAAVCSDTITIQDTKPHHLRNIVAAMSLNKVADTRPSGGNHDNVPCRRAGKGQFVLVCNNRADMKMMSVALSEAFSSDKATRDLYDVVFLCKDDDESGDALLLPKVLEHTNKIREARDAPKKTPQDVLSAETNLPKGSYATSDHAGRD